jgi:tripartite-type tricarboxylate transporter receptor subunit TctC
VNDLLAQQVQMVFLDLPVLLPQIQAGKLRPIAVGAPQRVPSAPDVPTTTEVGMAHLQTENWYGMVAPSGIPAPILAALHKAAVDALKDPEVISKLSSQGATLVGNTPDQFRAFIASETKKWAEVIKDAGVPVRK